MARNGSGTYTKVNTFTAGATITAASHNQNWDDIASEITNSVAADGQTTLTGPLKAASGTAVAPSHSFGSDTDTGMYRRGSNELGFSTAGVEAGYFDAAKKFWMSGAADVAGALNVAGVFSVGGVAKFPIATADIADGAVTLAKLVDASAQYKILARKTSGAGDWEECSLSDVLDFATGAAQGDILYRDAAGWDNLPAGTAGQFLKTGGAGANPSWVTPVFGAEYTSSDLTVTSASTATLTHGLGAAPKLVQLFLVCQTAEAGYSINDVVAYGNTGTFASAGSGISITVTSTSIIYRITDNTLWLTHKTSGASSNLTLANWKLRVKAFA